MVAADDPSADRARLLARVALGGRAPAISIRDPFGYGTSMNILGINAYHGDALVVPVRDGTLTALQALR